MPMDQPNSWVKPPPAPAGPPPLWWYAHAIGAAIVALPLMIWGLYAWCAGHTTIWYGWRRIEFYHSAARLLGVGLFVGSFGVFAQMFLTCFERIKWRAEAFARLTGVVFLVCAIAALVLRVL